MKHIVYKEQSIVHVCFLKNLLIFVVDCWVADDIFPVDTCVITLLTLERLGAFMIEHVFLQSSPQDL